MKNEHVSYVAYYRVSTKKQGRSGLGVEAQRETVERFVSAARGRLVGEFVEQESGKNSARPHLQSALSACRAHRAILVVAKLDRLARNAAFLLSLREASVEIIACDLPSMNRMTVGIMAVVAEEEARMISERTKLALAAAKRRGVKLGRPENLSNVARKLGTTISGRSRAATAKQRARDLAPIITQLSSSGCDSLRSMADNLSSLGVPSPRGARWSSAAVWRLQQTIKKLE